MIALGPAASWLKAVAATHVSKASTIPTPPSRAGLPSWAAHPPTRRRPRPAHRQSPSTQEPAFALVSASRACPSRNGPWSVFREPPHPWCRQCGKYMPRRWLPIPRLCRACWPVVVSLRKTLGDSLEDTGNLAGSTISSQQCSVRPPLSTSGFPTPGTQPVPLPTTALTGPKRALTVQYSKLARRHATGARWLLPTARSDHRWIFVGVSPCPLPRPGHQGPHDEDDRDFG